MMQEDGHYDWSNDVRAGRADAAAFARLVAAFERMASAAAYARLGDLQAAEDVTQEAFIEAYIHLDELRDPYGFPAWLRRIVAKHCDRVSRRRSVATVGAGALDLLPTPPAPGELSDAWTRLHAAVAALPAGQRQVVALTYFGELDQATVAALLCIPLSAVKARLRRARQSLRRTMMTFEQQEVDTRNAPPASPTTQIFLALRAGDAATVQQLLTADGSLVHTEEDWDEAEAARYRLGFARHGTPLIRAIERDELGIVDMLLAAGADPGQVCGCDAAEPPLWTAAVHGRLEHVERLLSAGADANVAAFRGVTPLHIAAMRGDVGIVRALIEYGAVSVEDSEGRLPSDWASANGHAEIAAVLGSPDASPAPRHAELRSDGWIATGIKSLDLFAPLPAAGMVRVASRPGVGISVFLAELSIRVHRRLGMSVIWTGFEQLPTDEGDIRHLLAESGAASDVELALVPRELDAEVRRARLRRTIEAARARAEHALVVVFEESELLPDTEALYGLLADDGFLAVVVSPILGNGEMADGPEAPFTCRVEFSADLAKRGNFPAIDPMRSRSAVVRPGDVDEVARRARVAIEAPTNRIQEQMEAHLTQPFFGTEPFTGRPGAWVEEDELVSDMEAILAGELDRKPDALRYRGSLDGDGGQ